jgi:hypothetical protein
MLCIRCVVICVVLTCSPLASAGIAPAEVKSAVAEFVGEDLPPSEVADLRAEGEAFNAERAGDVGLVLGIIFLLMAVGRGVQKEVAPSLSPAVFASCVIGALWFTVVDPAFYEFKAVDMDASGVTVETYTGDPVTVSWSDVTSVTVREGSAFPVFSDDRALVLAVGDGDDAVQVHIPAFVPGQREVAAQVLAHLTP